MTGGPAAEPADGGLALTVRPEPVFLCQPGPGPPPVPPAGCDFWSLTIADGEQALAAPASALPEGARRNGPWRVLTVAGPLPLDAVGVLLRLAEPLARAGVPIAPVATVDTDHLLVPGAQLARAVAALRAAGHAVAG